MKRSTPHVTQRGAMQIRMLGQLEASDSHGLLELGPPKQRALLARLAVDPSRTVRFEQLLDDLWDDDLPRSASKMVHSYVSQLRKALPGDRLLTEGGGYRLIVADGDRDVDRVQHLRESALAAMRRGVPATASRELAAALSLWRGPALGDLSEPFARQERARLEELRLLMHQERIDADIAAGADVDVIGELDTLIRAHPLRERPRAQLMRALYRAGRHAEALDVYRRFSRTLDEDLGLAPSQAMRELEGAILRQDHSLGATAAPRDTPTVFRAAQELPGRSLELAALAKAYAQVGAGQRHAVFVTGPPGIGKTALVESFLCTLADARVGRGQCVSMAEGEPYLPVMEALGDLGGDHASEAVVSGTTSRILRLVRTFEALAEQATVVVVLEDLHLADEDTVEFLSLLLRRSRRARLLLIGTMRPDDVAVGSVVAEALGRRDAELLPLAPLDASAVGSTLRERLDGADVPPALVGVLHERSGGNPLFAGLMLDHWTAGEALSVRDGIVSPETDVGELAVAVPPAIRASLEVQFGQLDPLDRHILEAASVASEPFTAAEVAAATERPIDGVASRLQALADELRFIDRRGGDAYAFGHELHRDVLRESLGPAERHTLHRRLGAYLERAPGTAHQEARIALHLIEGDDTPGAIRMLQVGAARALARNAHGVVTRYLRRALDLVESLPDGASRTRTELELRSAYDQTLVHREGWREPQAEDAFARLFEPDESSTMCGEGAGRWAHRPVATAEDGQAPPEPTMSGALNDESPALAGPS